MTEGDDEDEDGVYICHGCIGDSYLKEEIRQEGGLRQCHFCGKTRKSWSLQKLAERMEGVIEEHFTITPSDPGEDGLAYDADTDWERRGDSAEDVIAEIAEIESEIAEAVRQRISKKTSWDAHDGGYEDPFGSGACYEQSRPDTHGFHQSWEFFRQEIRTRSRFFGQSAQRALDEIFGDLASLRTWDGKPAIKEIQPTDEARFIFRARIAYSEPELRDILLKPVKELGPPPSNLARAGRMNAAGISVFYGAIEADTCVAEARAPVGSYVVLGRFEIIRPIRVLDLDVLTKVVTGRSWFDPEFTTRSSRATFLRHLVKEISRPIMPRDEEFEYLPTQVVSEYLASCVEPHLDGIIFHSAQMAREGRNVVLFHNAGGVESYALPDGTKVEINMGWSYEDDEDDSITIFEKVPAPKPKPKPKEVAKKTATKRVPSFAAILEAASTNDDSETDDDIFYGTPTLRLDVQNIEVHRIKSVTYKKVKRSVWRHRSSTDEMP